MLFGSLTDPGGNSISTRHSILFFFLQMQGYLIDLRPIVTFAIPPDFWRLVASYSAWPELIALQRCNKKLQNIITPILLRQQIVLPPVHDVIYSKTRDMWGFRFSRCYFATQKSPFTYWPVKIIHLLMRRCRNIMRVAKQMGIECARYYRICGFTTQPLLKEWIF